MILIFWIQTVRTHTHLCLDCGMIEGTGYLTLQVWIFYTTKLHCLITLLKRRDRGGRWLRGLDTSLSRFEFFYTTKLHCLITLLKRRDRGGRWLRGLDTSLSRLHPYQSHICLLHVKRKLSEDYDDWGHWIPHPPGLNFPRWCKSISWQWSPPVMWIASDRATPTFSDSFPDFPLLWPCIPESHICLLQMNFFHDWSN